MKALRDSKGRQVSTWMALVVIAALLAGGIALQYSIDGSSGSRAGWDDSTPFDTARSVLDVLGGVRESLATNLWSKTDDIFHEYMGGSVSKDVGVFPYYWLITKLHPRFAMAYYYASWTLARLGRVDEGFDLALEGVRYNPDSEMLQYNLASIYFFFKKDAKKARYHLLKAISLTDDEDQKLIYENFLSTVDQVISGERSYPELMSIEEADKLNEEVGEHLHEH